MSIARGSWVVVRDGKIASAHKTPDAAQRHAGADAAVAALPANPYGFPVFTFNVGDKVRVVDGVVVHA